MSVSVSDTVTHVFRGEGAEQVLETPSNERIRGRESLYTYLLRSIMVELAHCHC